MRVLTVCTHNRTRSVLMAATLEYRLIDAGCQPSIVSGGFGAVGQPPTARTVELLASRSIDVSNHLSSAVDEHAVELAQLIVCAERTHVVNIAGRYPNSFARTFTMPELAQLGELVGPVNGDLNGWLERITAHRLAGMDYLDADPDVIGEIRDPTGTAPSVWVDVFGHIDQLAARIARVTAA